MTQKKNYRPVLIGFILIYVVQNLLCIDDPSVHVCSKGSSPCMVMFPTCKHGCNLRDKTPNCYSQKIQKTIDSSRCQSHFSVFCLTTGQFQGFCSLSPTALKWLLVRSPRIFNKPWTSSVTCNVPEPSASITWMALTVRCLKSKYKKCYKMS